MLEIEVFSFRRIERTVNNIKITIILLKAHRYTPLLTNIKTINNPLQDAYLISIDDPPVQEAVTPNSC